MAHVTAFLMSALRLSLLFLYQLCIAAMYKKWQRTKEFFFFSLQLWRVFVYLQEKDEGVCQMDEVVLLHSIVFVGSSFEQVYGVVGFAYQLLDSYIIGAIFPQLSYTGLNA